MIPMHLISLLTLLTIGFSAPLEEASQKPQERLHDSLLMNATKLHNHSLRPSNVSRSHSKRDYMIQPSFPYGSSTKVRGVNLGGWLVLEPWITPSLFDNTGDNRIIDEWTFGQYYKSKGGANILKQHWDTWITENDFAQIKAAGLNHVRLPIGFWAWDVSGGEPYIQGQLPYVDKAIGWAAAHGLKVIIDLHGAPGSQNGFDNSGHKVSYPQWQASQSNIDRTNAIVKILANKYKDQTNVVSVISPLNEPAGFDGSAILNPLRQFYKDSYGNVRFPYGSAKESNTLLLLHDAFQDLSYWDGFVPAPDYQGVAFDTHIYQVFSNDEVSRTNQEHIQNACAQASELASFPYWVIVGEWTPAMTDCAKYLNGRGVGARYDGTKSGSGKVGSCSDKTGLGSSFSSSFKTFLRQMWEAQVISFEKGGDGWMMWNWKNEIADEWSYQAGLKYGWIPQNPSDLRYPNICG